VTGIPYGPAGLMIGLRSDPDADDYGTCRLCSSLPARSEFWQRGCPTTGLPVAPAWRPWPSPDEATVAGSAEVDAIASAWHAVAQAHQRVAAQQRALHTDNHAAVQRTEHADHHAAPVLTAGGGA
jgi:hypothetical protein